MTALVWNVLLAFALVFAMSACRSEHQSEKAAPGTGQAKLVAIDQTFETIRREFRDRDARSVGDELAHMVELDTFIRNQRTRLDLPASKRVIKDELAARVREVDRRNTKRIKELLQEHGWFRVSRFGREADRNAWLLVQHADQDRAFQEKTLELLEQEMAKGETDPGNYAYLHDRVAIASGEPQRYGTQGSCVGMSWREARLEDRQEIDNYRFSVGLRTLEEYRRVSSANCQ